MRFVQLHDVGHTANIGYYASWARHCNINYLQIQSVVRAGRINLNFTSEIQLYILNQQRFRADGILIFNLHKALLVITHFI